jgi:hypothetical protein
MVLEDVSLRILSVLQHTLPIGVSLSCLPCPSAAAHELVFEHLDLSVDCRMSDMQLLSGLRVSPLSTTAGNISAGECHIIPFW